MTLRYRDIFLEKTRHVTFCAKKVFFIILDVLDIPDDFWGKENFSPYKWSGLQFLGERHFLRPRDLFVSNTLFVILDVLDIPGEFGGKHFFP